MQQIAIVATIEVKPEYLSEVTELCKQMAVSSRNEPGNIQYDLHQSRHKENELCFVETWASQQVVHDHNESEHFNALKPYLEGKINNLTVELIHKVL